MSEIHETARVPVAPRVVWSEIGEFGSLAEWHPMLSSVELDGRDGPGARRTATGLDGSRQVERLESLDDDGRSYTYSLERTGLPVRNYTGKLRVEPVGTDEAVVHWIAEFEPDPGTSSATAEAIVRDFFRTGLDALKERFQ